MDQVMNHVFGCISFTTSIYQELSRTRCADALSCWTLPSIPLTVTTFVSSLAMLPWPKVRPRGGGKWSDASSIPERVSADDYDKFVRERLSGSQLRQSEATITAHLSQDACEALNELKRQSERASAESLGGLWTKLYSSTTANDTPAEATAVTDVVVNAERDLLQSLVGTN